MRDNLPKKPHKNECAVVNLASIKNSGSHWTSFCKQGSIVYYFDSFGNLKPPLELLRYFDKCKIVYNHSSKQNYDQYICGHLCLKFLKNFKWKDH